MHQMDNCLENIWTLCNLTVGQTLGIVVHVGTDLLMVWVNVPYSWNFHVFTMCWKNCFECQIWSYDSLLLLIDVERILELVITMWKLFEMTVNA